MARPGQTHALVAPAARLRAAVAAVTIIKDGTPATVVFFENIDGVPGVPPRSIVAELAKRGYEFVRRTDLDEDDGHAYVVEPILR